MNWQIFFTAGPAADWILLTAFHSLWLSLAGFFIIHIWKFKAPAARSIWCTFTLVLLLLAPLITWFAPQAVIRSYSIQNASIVTNTTVPGDAPLLNELLGIERPAPQARTNQWKAWINQFGLLWLAVTLGCMGRLLYALARLNGYTNCLRELKDDRLAVILQEISQSVGFRLKLRFYVSLIIPSPVAIGIRKPVIILPAALYQSIGNEELRAILLHELAHIHHSDHALGLLQQFVKALYWWNPFVYAISNALTTAREDVSDNYSIKAMGSAASYAKLLVRLIEETPVINRMPCVSGMATPYQSLQTRICNIVSGKRDLRVKAGKGSVAAISAAAVLMCGVICFGSQVKIFGIGDVSASRNSRPMAAVIKDWHGDFNMESLRRVAPVPAAHHKNKSQQSPIPIEGDKRTDAVTAPTAGVPFIRMMNLARSDAFPTLRNEGADPPQTTPIRLDESNPPVIRYRVDLEYPPAAKRAKLSGIVQFAVVVNEKGDVYEARIMMGHPLFHEPALNAVLQWKFEPKLVEGTLRPFSATVDVYF